MTLGRDRPTANQKTHLSFLIRDPEENAHRAGVNALRWSPEYGTLFSAGRDSVIRKWTPGSGKESDSMEHHTDWVNDFVLCDNGEVLISASSDQSLKVWNAQKAYCMSTLRTHKDYVSCLAYASKKHQLVSGGYDEQIFLWDVESLQHLTVDNSTVTCMNLLGATNSIYCVDTDPAGTIVAAGGTEKQLRLWDPRTQEKRMKLKGHKDNIRAVKISNDGRQCVSASSDGTVRLWSIGEQRVIRVFQISEQGIWTLAVDPNFRWVYAAGKQADITAISLVEPDYNYCVCREESPILSLELDNHNKCIWSATTNSNISYWRIQPDEDITAEKFSGKSEQELAAPYREKPEYQYPGLPAIKQYKVLPNRRYILTCDSNHQVAMYDVLKAEKIKIFRNEKYEDVLARYDQQMLYVPSWFSVDLKCGFLQIILQEEDAFHGHVGAKDVDLKIESRINLGRFLLVNLLQKWPPLQRSLETAQSRPESLVGSENGSRTETDAQSQTDDLNEALVEEHATLKSLIDNGIRVPKHTVVMLQETNGPDKCRISWNQVGSEPHMKLFNDNVPQWIKDGVLKSAFGPSNKVPFVLLPFSQNEKRPLPILKKERLTAGDMLQIRKVAKHVYEKIFLEDSEMEVDEEEAILTANNQIEILCNEQSLDPDYDLRTVKHLIWKKHNSIELYYRKRRDSPKAF